MGILLNLQRGVLPNIYVLKKLIPWFDAVSNLLEGFVASFAAESPMAKVDAAAAYQFQQGFTGVPVRPGGSPVGVYDLTLATAVDPNRTIVHATVMNNSVTWDGGIDTEFVNDTTIRVAIRHTTPGAGGAAGVASDQTFVVSLRILTPP